MTASHRLSHNAGRKCRGVVQIALYFWLSTVSTAVLALHPGLLRNSVSRQGSELVAASSFIQLSGRNERGPRAGGGVKRRGRRSVIQLSPAKRRSPSVGMASNSRHLLRHALLGHVTDHVIVATAACYPSGRCSDQARDGRIGRS